MYGPEATTYLLYVDGLSSSNFSAYSFGTGVLTGMISDAAKPGPCGLGELERRSVRVVGVSMPGMSLSAPGFFGAPSMELKYAVYWFGDVLRERALEGVLDVLRRDLAVDRRAELDALPQLDRDRLACRRRSAARRRRGPARLSSWSGFERVERRLRRVETWKPTCSTSGRGRGSRRQRRRAAELAALLARARWRRCSTCRLLSPVSLSPPPQAATTSGSATSARAARIRRGDLIMQRSFPGCVPLR